MLQGMTDRVIEIGNCCEMEINVEKLNVIRLSKQQSPVQIVIGQKQLKNVKYFKCLCNVITNGARFSREIRSKNAMAKQHLTRRRILPPSKLDLNLRKKLVKGYILSISVWDIWESR
jgi:tRNA(Ile2) C34 agmatinyltransferase TiaS